MKKPADLRQFLLANLPDLQTNPDNILIFIDKGRVVSTLKPALSFEYHYTLNIVLTDYSGEADSVMLPMLVWLRKNQYNLLHASEETAINFEAELLNNDTADLSITLALSERVIVSQSNGTTTIEHVDEPPLEDPAGALPWSLYLNGIATPL